MIGLKRLFTRPKPAPVLDPVGYRLPSYLTPSDQSLAMPPPPPPPLVGETLTPGPPRVRLMMEDGTVEGLPTDPEVEARAAYLVRSMLPPAPPPPNP